MGEALLAEDITVYLGDSVSPGLDSPVSAGLTVFIERSTPVVIFADGNTLKTRTRQETVADALTEQDIVLAGMDQVSPSLTTPLLDNMAIRVTRLREDIEIEQELIPFDSTWIADDGLELDHQRLDEGGQEGVTNTRYKVITADGQEINRALEYTWVAQEPVTRTMAYGRKVVTRTLETPQGTLVYWRKIRMSATSYSASTAGVSPDNPYYGYTRMGDPMRHGIVAVDPAVIRLGFIGEPTGRHIAFAADDRLDLGLQGLLIEIEGPEHGAVIGNGHGIHTELTGPFQKPVDPDGPIQETVLGVNVQMDEFRCGDGVHNAPSGGHTPV